MKDLLTWDPCEDMRYGRVPNMFGVYETQLINRTFVAHQMQTHDRVILNECLTYELHVPLLEIVE